MVLVLDGIDSEIGISALPGRIYKQLTTSSLLTLESFRNGWSRYHSIFLLRYVYGTGVLRSGMPRRKMPDPDLSNPLTLV
jgi:hypothetical protein